jgi:diacylglycerol kinase family enzyme
MFQRRGQVTSLVSCGGDGTFNLVARAALAADVPVGILPMGRFNNIGRSLYSDLSAVASIKRIAGREFRLIDVGNVSGQPFFGAIGLGLIPRLMKILAEQKTPRLGLGWARLVSQAASKIKPKKFVVKVDAFRFEIAPTLLNVNLLPYAGGLALSPASLADDRRAEIIFDISASHRELGTYSRRIHSGKFIYGSNVRLFRGAVITIQPVLGRTLYLDGELIELPTNLIEIKIDDKQLKVLQ